jgi:hypothetical protein
VSVGYDYRPFLPFTALHPRVDSQELHAPITRVLQELIKDKPTLQHVKVYPVLLDGDGNFSQVTFSLVYSDRATEEENFLIKDRLGPNCQLVYYVDTSR